MPHRSTRWRWGRSSSKGQAVVAPPDATIVVPTIGRSSLDALLQSLARQPNRPRAVIVVDDRRVPAPPLSVPGELASDTTILHSGGRGPAAARNIGWKAATTQWVCFLDDDVIPMPSWSHRLAADLAAPADVGATQAVIVVPRPQDRRLTDQERNVASLEHAGWITADLAVRRTALVQLRGFDERFPRAYREDSDFALRAAGAGWRFEHGSRSTYHPLRTGRWWSSVSAQRGNRDDALMRVIHGRRWTIQRGRRRRHVAITVAGVVALGAAMTRHRRVAAAFGLAWITGTAELAAARIQSGQRSRREVAAMLVTSVAIPPAATWWWSTGLARWRAGKVHAWGGSRTLPLTGFDDPADSNDNAADRPVERERNAKSPVAP